MTDALIPPTPPAACHPGLPEYPGTADPPRPAPVAGTHPSRRPARATAPGPRTSRRHTSAVRCHPPGDGRSRTAAGPSTSRRARSTRPPPPSCAACSRSWPAAAPRPRAPRSGRHQLWGEVVCLDPLAWLRAGLVTNPGMFVLGQPGTGKSALVKRLVTGAVAFGTRVLILGDTKPDYTPLVRHLGGQVIRIGRGLDRINPLDAGPLGAALRADDRRRTPSSCARRSGRGGCRCCWPWPR